MNTVLAPSPANHFATNPYTVPNATNGFRVGSNCLYVLVEDTGGATGFDLNGTVSATAGLLSTPAKGPNQSYTPCSCSQIGPVPIDTGLTDVDSKISALMAEQDDAETVKEIIKFAEERRAQRISGDVK